MSKLSNILRMMILLESKGKMKIKELSDILEVKERMIRKYKDDLEQAGIYVVSSQGINGGYELSGIDYLLNLNLTADEYEALNLADEQLKSIDFFYYNEFNLAIEKITSANKKSNSILNEFHFMVKGIGSNEANLDRKKCVDINAAIISKNKILINYLSLSTGEKERIVHPYAVIHYKGALYFVGFCEYRKELRDFKISRIRSYKILDESFEIDKNFLLKDYMYNNIGIYNEAAINIKLKIEKPMSYIVSEKLWVENQKIIWQEDESIIFEATMKGKTEIVSWVLGMGKYIKVLEPENLKNEIKEQISIMLDNYL